MCEEFHLSVRQALHALAVPDVNAFDRELVAEECALLMFEVMDYRSFAAAKRAYAGAKPEDHPKMVREHAMVALVQEMEFELAKEQLRARKARKAKP